MKTGSHNHWLKYPTNPPYIIHVTSTFKVHLDSWADKNFPQIYGATLMLRIICHNYWLVSWNTVVVSTITNSKHASWVQDKIANIWYFNAHNSASSKCIWMSFSLMKCSLKAGWKVHFVLFMQANFNGSCLASSWLSLYAAQRSLIRFQKYGQSFQREAQQNPLSSWVFCW